jgi:transcriptional regulator with XRE-family HTH domain
VSIIVDDPAAEIAARIRLERERHGWSLGELAERSGVSKAMLSKVEREEASPTAVILARIATALGLTLAGLVSPADHTKARRVLPAKEQPRWTDPATGYVRRQIFQSPDHPLELVEVSLPPGKRVAFPASSYAFIRQVVWVLGGELELHDGDNFHTLKSGDRLEFGPPADHEFRNRSAQSCRYLVALVRLT